MLAEANVSDDELKEYLGKADGAAIRVLMVFAFRLNQALVLALARQDARPIAATLRQLPALPQHGQWATFLRNHDEVDLGRLTAEERQEVFAAFAPEPDMQIYGRGIRRRLAPMLGGNRRRLELAYSLLLSMPGTPVIRYGEEIGMGENLACPSGKRSAPRCSGMTRRAPASHTLTQASSLLLSSIRARTATGGSTWPASVSTRTAC